LQARSHQERIPPTPGSKSNASLERLVERSFAPSLKAALAQLIASSANWRLNQVRRSSNICKHRGATRGIVDDSTRNAGPDCAKDTLDAFPEEMPVPIAGHNFVDGTHVFTLSLIFSAAS
jgi:hypothetical protein